MLGDIGDLGPHHKAGLVAGVIKHLVVLVVGQAHCVGADLFDDLNVLKVLLGRKRVANALAVLVARHAAQRVGAPIQEEALVGVDVERANAKAGGHLVDHGAVLTEKLQLGRVEVRVVHAVPAVDVGKRQGHVGALPCRDLGAGSVDQAHAHAGRVGCGALDPGLDLDLGVLLAVCNVRGDLETGGTVVVKRKVRRRDDQQLDIAVDAAVEGEVGLLRVDAIVLGVVDGHAQGVGARDQRVGDVHAEGRVAAVVVAQGLSVDLDVGRGVDALELQVDDLRGGVERRRVKAALVGAGAAPVVVAAVLAVDGVPGVGHVDLLNGAGGTREIPALVQVDVSAHGTASPLLKETKV